MSFSATVLNPQLTCTSSLSQPWAPSVLILTPTQHADNLIPHPSCSILFSIILICTFRPLVNACSGLKKNPTKNKQWYHQSVNRARWSKAYFWYAHPVLPLSSIFGERAYQNPTNCWKKSAEILLAGGVAHFNSQYFIQTVTNRYQNFKLKNLNPSNQKQTRKQNPRNLEELHFLGPYRENTGRQKFA